LTDISIDWNGLSVEEIYPSRIPDLFSAKPVIIHGRYSAPGNATIYLKGNVAGQQLVRSIDVNFPELNPENNVVATLWARTKIDDLMSNDWEGIQNEEPDESIKSQIEKLGLDFRLMTQFTSFVAVEDQTRTNGGETVKVIVPNDNPEGAIRRIDEGPMSPSTTPRPSSNFKIGNRNMSPPTVVGRSTYGKSNSSGASMPPKVISGGVVNGKAISLPVPSLPPAGKAVGVVGTVSVQVVIDESGNVISTSAVSGHPLLRAAAENAARRSKFAPTQLSGKPVKVTGVIVYNFAPGTTNVLDTLDSPEITKPLETQEMKKLRLMREKFHPQIMAVVENQLAQKRESAKFVKDGVAIVEIWINEITPGLREKLKEIGFKTINEKEQMYFMGTLNAENLEKLAEIIEIQYVSPRFESPW
jgi:TonB family protein